VPVVVGCSDDVSWWLYLLRLAGITIRDVGPQKSFVCGAMRSHADLGVVHIECTGRRS